MTILHKFIKLFVIIFWLSVSVAVAQNGNSILSYRTNVFLKNDKLVTDVSFIIEVYDKEADWITDISIRYDKEEELAIREAVITDRWGNKLRKLSNKEIRTSSDISYGSFYEDGMIKEFSLKWNEYPYRIKYSYRKVSSKYLFLAHWDPVIYLETPTRDAHLTITLPADYEVTIDADERLKYDKPVDNSTTVSHHWSISDYTIAGRESFAPPLRELIPQVIVFPKNFNYGVSGKADSWKSYGLWHENLNNGLTRLPVSEQKTVDDLLADITDKEEKIKVLYNYMQDHTRYIYVGIDVGGMKPYPASYVCENKYGDCKALTIYLKALLEYAGIESFYTVINAGKNATRINRELPFQQFNHVILSVPMGQDTIWLENTSSYTAYNYMGGFTQDRNSLIVNGEQSALVRTPALKEEDVLESKTLIFDLSKDGSGTLELQASFRGDRVAYLNRLRQEGDQDDRKKEVEKMAGLKHMTSESFGIEIPDRNKSYAEVNGQFTLEKQMRIIGDLMAISLPPFAIYDLKRPDERKHPVRINAPVSKKDSIIYRLPFLDSYTVELPENLDLENQFGSMKITFDYAEKEIVVKRHLKLAKGDYDLEQYQKFYEMMEVIGRYHRRAKIVLTRKS